MSRSRIVAVVAGPIILHPVTQRRAEQLCSEGRAERKSQFLIAMVDRGGGAAPSAVSIEGGALLGAFYGRPRRDSWNKPMPETANEIDSLIRRRSPYAHALNKRPKSRRRK
jgi:hypothetical protein